ncbi:hypothetical protein [Gemmatimonas sp.]|uniref:hypothetical protein n=1 Tax=Gemmatimonas sp. TaxID=1962908 RepID=UPI003983CA9B
MILVALDANHMRGAPVSMLIELRDRGVRLCVTALTLQELWARAQRDNTRTAFDRRIAKLAELLDPAAPLLAAGSVLMHGVNEDSAAVWEEMATHGRELWSIWSKAATMSDAEWKRYADASEQGINEIADPHVAYYKQTRETIRRLRREGRLTTTAQRFRADLFEQFQSTGTARAATRLDAYHRVAALRAARFAFSNDHGDPDPNDVEDEAMLQQLARPVFVATDDRRLIADVDGSGSTEAPWVRRLADFFGDDLPSGTPWDSPVATFTRRPAREALELHSQIKAQCDTKHPRPPSDATPPT